MKCILLCAGYSTDENLKLRETASSLTLINNKPLVNYTIEALDDIEVIDEIYLVTNGVYYEKFLEWNQQFSFSTKITIINDNTSSSEAKLGAIGDIRYTINCANIEEDIMVLAGDIYFDFDLEDFVNYYLAKGQSVVAGMDTDDKELLTKTGVIEEKNNVIIGMQEKPLEPKGNIVSLAAYIYTSDILRDFDEYLSEGNKTTYPGYFLEYLYRFKPINVYKIEGSFYDVKSRQSIEKIECIISNSFDK